MDLMQASKQPPSIRQDSSGVALFMVLSAVSILCILVSEFSYIAQISQAIAYGGLDQTKAHYLAKSGLKLSLLRLKAYQQVKSIAGSMAGGAPGASGLIPKAAIEQIWKFPFIYPIPTELLGADPSSKAAIEKFQSASNLEGSYTSQIESESSRFNLNSILGVYAAQGSTAPKAPLPNSNSSPLPNPSASPEFDPEASRKSLSDYLRNILKLKGQTDPDFSALHSDYRLDDLVDQIAAWSDRTYERRTSNNRDRLPMKRAPFYSVTELHMLPAMEDDLYDLFAPQLTASTVTGININTVGASVLRSLIPDLSAQEAQSFIDYRDSATADNQFRDTESFFTYLQKQVAAFKGSPQSILDLKTTLANRGISLVTDESQFKITVRAQVNRSSRTIIAWVSFGNTPTRSTPQNSSPDYQQNNVPTVAARNSGMKITYMREF